MLYSLLNAYNEAFKSQQTDTSAALVESKTIVEKLTKTFNSEITEVKTSINETYSSLAVLTRADQEIDNRMNSYHKKGWSSLCF